MSEYFELEVASPYMLLVAPVTVLLCERLDLDPTVSAVLMGLVGTSLSPGPTDVGVPTLLVAAWLLGRRAVQ